MKALLQKKWFRIILLILGVAALGFLILYLHAMQTIKGLEEALEGLGKIFQAFDQASAPVDSTGVTDTLRVDQ